MVNSIKGNVEVVFIFGTSNNDFLEAQRQSYDIIFQEQSNLTKDY